MHYPALTLIVVDGVVLSTAIVPDGQGARLPSKPAAKFWAHRMVLQKIDDGRAFLRRHAVEEVTMAANIERLAPSFWMRAN